MSTFEELKERYIAEKKRYHLLKDVYGKKTLYGETNGNKLFFIDTAYEELEGLLGNQCRITLYNSLETDTQYNNIFNINDFKDSREFENLLIENKCIYLPLYLHTDSEDLQTSGTNCLGFIYRSLRDCQYLFRNNEGEWIWKNRDGDWIQKEKDRLEELVEIINQNKREEFYRLNVRNIDENENEYTVGGIFTLEEAIAEGRFLIGLTDEIALY